MNSGGVRGVQRRMFRAVVLASLCIGSAAHAEAPKGTIKGTVIFEGEPPERATLKRDTDPYCKQGDGLAEDVVVTKGKLRDVLVRVKTGPVPKASVPAQPAVIDQRGCAYVPHVIGMVAGQKLAVRNSDGTNHFVWGQLAGKTLWNKPQMAKAADLSLESTAKPGDVIDLKCGAHPWMQAYAVVQEHPFFAVTGDTGAFEIKGLPPGEYTLEAWHPKLGTKLLTVKIGTGPKATITARFSYKASE